MVSPVLKWAGGKNWLAEGDLLPAPKSYRRYVEPFLGGGAVFFHLSPPNSLLSDLNKSLVSLYQVLRDHPDELWVLMKRHHSAHSREYYYGIRASEPSNPLEAAGRFLYLNRTCWNGLYRVNRKGEFNVPIGTKSTVIFERDDFRAVAARLANAEIRCSDFEGVIAECGKGDFVFVDPPYTVQHNFNNFLKYNEKIFSWDDQVRLREAIEGAVRRGAFIAVTNADHETVRGLYADLGTYIQLGRRSTLAGDSSKRGATTEALFLSNYC
jgi:DNA adenine methylase